MNDNIVWYLIGLLAGFYFLLMGYMPKTGIDFFDYNSFVSFSYALIIGVAIIIHIIYKQIKEVKK